MNVLAADEYILCCGLLRTLMLLYGDVHVTPANSIDDVLARIPELLDLDLVVLDASMPGMERLAGLRRTVDMIPDVPVIVTSPAESRSQIVAAIRDGARGYFPLSCKPCVLQHALPLIMAGEVYIPASAVRGGTSHALPRSEGPGPQVFSAAVGLTPRQHEVAVMLAQGKSNKEIARELKMLEGTVKIHVKGILRKLGVRNRTEAAMAAARAGYLPKETLETGPSRLERIAGDVDHKMPGASAPAPPSQPESEQAPLCPALVPPIAPDCSARDTHGAASGLGKRRASPDRRPGPVPQPARGR